MPEEKKAKSETSEAEQEKEKEVPEEEEDVTLKMLTARRMLELRKRATTAAKISEGEKLAPKKPSDREVLLKVLSERGDEVLHAAEASYPSEMALLIPKLADLVRQRKVTTITGGELLQFLRAIGLRVSVQTSISVEDHGKFVSLGEKLKQQQQD